MKQTEVCSLIRAMETACRWVQGSRWWGRVDSAQARKAFGQSYQARMALELGFKYIEWEFVLRHLKHREEHGKGVHVWKGSGCITALGR